MEPPASAMPVSTVFQRVSALYRHRITRLDHENQGKCLVLLTNKPVVSKLPDMRTKRSPDSEPLEVTRFVGEVGSRIRLMRLARRISQAELAQRAELSRATLYEIEKGSLRTRFSDIARLL